jgi:hypothetical protein
MNILKCLYTGFYLGLLILLAVYLLGCSSKQSQMTRYETPDHTYRANEYNSSGYYHEY